MTREELDWLWQRALNESVQDGEKYIRYHFAALVAEKEREACAKVCEGEALLWPPSRDFTLCAAAIRARGKNE
jgi:hypothetical protein